MVELIAGIDPATPFVLKFLGDVNLFRGHFHAVHAPGQQAENPAADENTVYVRPHEIEVVDEPAAGMTLAEREATTALLRRLAETRAVVVVEHDMDFVRRLNCKVTVLHQGAVLAEGSLDHVSANPQVIEVYLGR